MTLYISFCACHKLNAKRVNSSYDRPMIADISVATVFHVIETSIDDEGTVFLMDRMAQHFYFVFCVRLKKSFVPLLAEL